jgi:ATP-dependent RNA helicase DeaD
VREVKVNESEIEAFLPAVYEELHDISKQELIKRFASIEFNRFLDYYRNAVDLNQEDGKGQEGGDRFSTGSRFFINLGKMDGLEKGDLLSLIDDTCDVDGKFIGRIELKGAYSFFEVEKEKADAILEGFKDMEYRGRQVRVELTEHRSPRGDSRDEKRGKSSKGGFARKKFSDHKRKRY